MRSETPEKVSPKPEMSSQPLPKSGSPFDGANVADKRARPSTKTAVDGTQRVGLVNPRTNEQKKAKVVPNISRKAQPSISDQGINNATHKLMKASSSGEGKRHQLESVRFFTLRKFLRDLVVGLGQSDTSHAQCRVMAAVGVGKQRCFAPFTGRAPGRAQWIA